MEEIGRACSGKFSGENPEQKMVNCHSNLIFAAMSEKIKDIIAESVAALQLEATVDDLMSTVHAHPTVWEAMSDAVAAVRGLSINA